MVHHYRAGHDDAVRALFSLSALLEPDQLGDFFNKWITSHNSDLDYLWRVHRFVVEGGKQSVDKEQWDQIKDVTQLGTSLLDPDIMFHRFNKYARELGTQTLMKGPSTADLLEFFPHRRVAAIRNPLPRTTFHGMKD